MDCGKETTAVLLVFTGSQTQDLVNSLRHLIPGVSAAEAPKVRARTKASAAPSFCKPQERSIEFVEAESSMKSIAVGGAGSSDEEAPNHIKLSAAFKRRQQTLRKNRLLREQLSSTFREGFDKENVTLQNRDRAPKRKPGRPLGSRTKKQKMDESSVKPSDVCNICDGEEDGRQCIIPCGHIYHVACLASIRKETKPNLCQFCGKVYMKTVPVYG